MGWTIRVPGFDSRRGLGIFLFTTASRTALELTQLSIQWVPGAPSAGVMRPGHKADHSPPSSAEVKECVELYFHFPNTSSRRGTWLSTGTTLLLPLPLYACYDSVQNPLPSRLLSKNVKIKTYKTMILHVILYGYETWPPTHRT
jgi:hypothetical protein